MSVWSIIASTAKGFLIEIDCYASFSLESVHILPMKDGLEWIREWHTQQFLSSRSNGGPSGRM
jgi:hypothetical protein